MTRFPATLLFGLLVGSGTAAAHHSFVMYSDNEIEIRGILKTYRFTAPHTSILLDVKNTDGTTTTWTLESLRIDERAISLDRDRQWRR